MIEISDDRINDLLLTAADRDVFARAVRALVAEAAPAAAHGAPLGEPIAWRATTVAYRQFVTQRTYDAFSPEVRRWYEPYRCAACAAAPLGEPLTDDALVVAARKACEAMCLAWLRSGHPWDAETYKTIRGAYDELRRALGE